jgi:ATP-binding cassette, subfamily B (MDR/TAP), member 1
MQRILIARAVPRCLAFLLPDEVTTVLDAQSECTVQWHQRRPQRGHGTVLVAHRPSGVRSADIISITEHGEIEDFGGHEELMRKPDGAQHELISPQDFISRPSRP